MDEHKRNFGKLLYAATLVMLFETLQTLIHSKIMKLLFQQSVGRAIWQFLLIDFKIIFHYFLGPVGILFYGQLVQKLYFRFLFFITALFKVTYLGISLVLLTYLQKENNFELPFILVIVFETLLGAANPLYICTVNYYVASLSNQENQSLYYGLFYSIYGISGFLAGIISSAKLFEFDDVFYVLISLQVVCCVCFWFVKEKDQIREESIRNALQATEIESSAAHLKMRFSTGFRDLLQVVKDYQECLYLVPNMIVLSFVHALCNIFLHREERMLKIIVPVPFCDPLVEGPEKCYYQEDVKLEFYMGCGMILGGLFTGLISDIFGFLQTILASLGYVLLFCVLGIVIDSLKCDLLESQKKCNAYTLVQYELLKLVFYLGGLSFFSLMTATISLIARKVEEHPQIIALFVWIYCWGYAFAIQLFWLSTVSSQLLTVCYSSILFLMAIDVCCLLKFKRIQPNDSAFQYECMQ